MPKTLYCGDNLEVLRHHITDESIDLIYLDPPFNSSASYNIIFKQPKDGTAQAQIRAFEDTWQWGIESERALNEVLERHGRLANFLTLLVKTLGKNSLSAYLVMMSIRLIELHRALKPTGSIYLHCDPTASHYLKAIMDTIFGPRQFVNEIIWRRYGSHNDASQGSQHFGRVHDTILFYRRSNDTVWNQQFMPLSDEYIKKNYRYEEEETGRRYTTKPLTAPGGAAKGNPEFEWNGYTRAWRYSRETFQRLHDEGKLHYSRTGYVRQKHYLDESKGVPVQDLWMDIPALAGANKERLGYPTQKPVALLERIIEASSNPGDIILDPFCGCGTAVAAAEKLDRQWIGIDITYLAINLIQARLRRDHDLLPEQDYALELTPKDMRTAQALFDQDPYQFQFWINGLIGAQSIGAGTTKGKGRRGGDGGIDGQLFFRSPGGETIERVIVSVKGGKNLNPGMVRDLRGVMDREGAALGVFVSLSEPTRGMTQEAASAGLYEYGSQSIPKLQLLTVEQLLAGVQPGVPRGSLNVSLEQKPVKTIQTDRRAKDMDPLFKDSEGRYGAAHLN